ncbi:hypothetical protein Mgra_00000375 [Meloidogyne graminicola]|uniref:Uncharacterized protein n=1 Tax=Meloidogyne graminicola TaxID=189291 RepID=A0A8T0A3J0_9BILA|nr:hypothetical protein Mgra_00000375 [Meloidogyne graminicola]
MANSFPGVAKRLKLFKQIYRQYLKGRGEYLPLRDFKNILEAKEICDNIDKILSSNESERYSYSLKCRELEKQFFIDWENEIKLKERSIIEKLKNNLAEKSKKWKNIFKKLKNTPKGYKQLSQE